MSKLFIIGNGFDLAHGMPTSYKNFHNFLQEMYPDIDEEFAIVPEYTIGHHGEMIYKKSEVAGYLMNLLSRTIGEDWKDMENALGHLDFADDFYELPARFDHDGDRNLFHEAYDNEDLAFELSNCVPMISNFFTEWINTIDVSSDKKKPTFLSLITPETDYFLSFNYTLTLEKLYGINSVCHIHGIQGKEIIFGHGAPPLFHDEEGNFHESKFVGCETYLEGVQSALQKDTVHAIETHKNFFRSLRSGITAIYSYGFSFGEVDLIYLKEIFKNVDTRNIIWYLHAYDSKNHDKQEGALRKSGFKGSIDVFDA